VIFKKRHEVGTLGFECVSPLSGRGCRRRMERAALGGAAALTAVHVRHNNAPTATRTQLLEVHPHDVGDPVHSQPMHSADGQQALPQRVELLNGGGTTELTRTQLLPHACSTTTRLHHTSTLLTANTPSEARGCTTTHFHLPSTPAKYATNCAHQAPGLPSSPVDCKS
jgi:hypothetical protein